MVSGQGQSLRNATRPENKINYTYTFKSFHVKNSTWFHSPHTIICQSSKLSDQNKPLGSDCEKAKANKQESKCVTL